MLLLSINYIAVAKEVWFFFLDMSLSDENEDLIYVVMTFLFPTFKKPHYVTVDKKDELANKFKANPNYILIWSQNRRDDIVSSISTKYSRILRSSNETYNRSPNHNL